MRRITRILIANRGEIAVRVIRTAHELGYEALSVYSEADARAPHVALADAAMCIGPAPVGSSYLDAKRILKAAAEMNADAVHPGYGFLAENEAFAKACTKAGLIFIGPPPRAIRIMGDKAEAKRKMQKAGVPCVPGYEGEEQSDKILVAEAKKIGFPIMVKASAGGGGRGMRLVEDAKRLPDALASARSEAKNAFGSDTLILERAVQNARHVEIQVFADTQGHTIHFGERDCSVQRRHQKVIEEAPCPVMTESLRAAMGKAAVEAARSIGYVGAGTVEFLLDEAGHFYFLEMNTRLQVEHPVSEMITGQDLVALQLRVAEGHPLGIAQDDVRFSGHAMEARLYAEDPSQGFLPSAGRLDVWEPPSGAGVRVDAGIAEGSHVSPFYDPMIAKIIAHGPDRETARRRLIRALANTFVFGPSTNKAFLMDVLAHEAFADGRATTAFLGAAFGDDIPPKRFGSAHAAVAGMLQYRARRAAAREASVVVADELRDWHSAGELLSRFAYAQGDETMGVAVRPTRADAYRVEVGDLTTDVVFLKGAGRHARVSVGGIERDVHYVSTAPETLCLTMDGQGFAFTDSLALAATGDAGAAGGEVRAPMHGRVQAVFVAVGARVEIGAKLAILEAMKMEHEIIAPVAGEVIAVHVAVDAQIPADTIMLEIKEEETP